MSKNTISQETNGNLLGEAPMLCFSTSNTDSTTPKQKKVDSLTSAKRKKLNDSSENESILSERSIEFDYCEGKTIYAAEVSLNSAVRNETDNNDVTVIQHFVPTDLPDISSSPLESHNTDEYVLFNDVVDCEENVDSSIRNLRESSINDHRTESFLNLTKSDDDNRIESSLVVTNTVMTDSRNKSSDLLTAAQEEKLKKDIQQKINIRTKISDGTEEKSVQQACYKSKFTPLKKIIKTSSANISIDTLSSSGITKNQNILGRTKMIAAIIPNTAKVSIGNTTISVPLLKNMTLLNNSTYLDKTTLSAAGTTQTSTVLNHGNSQQKLNAPKIVSLSQLMKPNASTNIVQATVVSKNLKLGTIDPSKSAGDSKSNIIHTIGFPKLSQLTVLQDVSLPKQIFENESNSPKSNTNINNILEDSDACSEQTSLQLPGFQVKNLYQKEEKSKEEESKQPHASLDEQGIFTNKILREGKESEIVKVLLHSTEASCSSSFSISSVSNSAKNNINISSNYDSICIEDGSNNTLKSSNIISNCSKDNQQVKNNDDDQANSNITNKMIQEAEDDLNKIHNSNKRYVEHNVEMNENKIEKTKQSDSIQKNEETLEVTLDILEGKEKDKTSNVKTTTFKSEEVKGKVIVESRNDEVVDIKLDNISKLQTKSTTDSQLSPLSKPNELTTNMANVSEQLRTIMSNINSPSVKSSLSSHLSKLSKNNSNEDQKNEKKDHFQLILSDDSKIVHNCNNSGMQIKKQIDKNLSPICTQNDQIKVRTTNAEIGERVTENDKIFVNESIVSKYTTSSCASTSLTLSLSSAPIVSTAPILPEKTAPSAEKDKKYNSLMMNESHSINDNQLEKNIRQTISVRPGLSSDTELRRTKPGEEESEKNIILQVTNKKRFMDVSPDKTSISSDLKLTYTSSTTVIKPCGASTVVSFGSMHKPNKLENSQNVLLKQLLQNSTTSSASNKNTTNQINMHGPRKIQNLRAPSLGVVSSLEAQLARPVIPPVVADSQSSSSLLTKTLNDSKEGSLNSKKENNSISVSNSTFIKENKNNSYITRETSFISNPQPVDNKAEQTEPSLQSQQQSLNQMLHPQIQQQQKLQQLVQQHQQIQLQQQMQHIHQMQQSQQQPQHQQQHNQKSQPTINVQKSYQQSQSQSQQIQFLLQQSNDENVSKLAITSTTGSLIPVREEQNKIPTTKSSEELQQSKGDYSSNNKGNSPSFPNNNVGQLISEQIINSNAQEISLNSISKEISSDRIVESVKSKLGVDQTAPSGSDRKVTTKRKREFQKNKKQQSNNKETQLGVPKKRGKKSDKVDQDYDDFIDNLMLQIRQLPPLQVLEPLLNRNFNICNIYGSSQTAKPGDFHEKVNIFNSKDIKDFYNMEPFGPENPFENDDDPESAIQNGFYDQEFPTCRTYPYLIKTANALESTLLNRDLGTPSSIVSCSSGAESDDDGYNKNSIASERDQSMNQFEQRHQLRSDGKVSPPVNIVSSSSRKRKYESKIFKDINNEYDSYETSEKDKAKFSRRHSNKQPNLTVTLTLTPNIAENIFDILKELSHILRVPSPDVLKLIDSKEDLSFHVQKTTSTSSIPPTVAAASTTLTFDNNNKHNITIKNMVNSLQHSMQPLPKESHDIQAILNSNSKFCRHCDVLIVNAKLRFKNSQPSQGQDNLDTPIDGEEKSTLSFNKNGDLYFCSKNCYNQYQWRSRLTNYNSCNKVLHNRSINNINNKNNSSNNVNINKNNSNQVKNNNHKVYQSHLHNENASDNRKDKNRNLLNKDNDNDKDNNEIDEKINNDHFNIKNDDDNDNGKSVSNNNKNVNDFDNNSNNHNNSNNYSNYNNSNNNFCNVNSNSNSTSNSSQNRNNARTSNSNNNTNIHQNKMYVSNKNINKNKDNYNDNDSDNDNYNDEDDNENNYENDSNSDNDNDDSYNDNDNNNNYNEFKYDNGNSSSEDLSTDLPVGFLSGILNSNTLTKNFNLTSSSNQSQQQKPSQAQQQKNASHNEDYVKIKRFSKEVVQKPAVKFKRKTDKEIVDMLFRMSITVMPQNGTDDTRQCIFCSQIGDGVTDGPSRLLNFDVDKWVHLNCALWSDGVYETVNGGLMNFESAIQASLNQCCVICHRTGATVKCFKTRCCNIYHLSCALKDQCVFYKNKTVFCSIHASKNEKDNELSTLNAQRRIYIERDENRQVAAIMHQSEISNLLRVGNLILLNVGQLLPHQLNTFHSENYIYPVGYKIIRFYWSMSKSNKRCRYVCSISDIDNAPEFRVIVQEANEPDAEFKGTTPKLAWMPILNKMADLRRKNKLVNVFPKYLTGEDLFGLTEPAITRILESLPGVDTLTDYRFKYGRNPLLELPLAINPSGAARTEQKQKLSFHWKRSHTQRTSSTTNQRCPSFIPPISVAGEVACPYSKQFVHSKSSQYKKMKQEWRNNVYLARSKIQGLGLYAARELEKHTMVIEYIGEIIRTEVSELREKQYEARNRGIYMFRLDEDRVVDATLSGGLARYINHSCNPNCVTEIVEVDRELRIIIFARRRIDRGEELSYDYKFDLEDDANKISCMCGAPNCRKWMN